MSQVTKRALEASLKNLLLQKPLNKITINDIAEDCGISRMTFYYHFKDIYDLVEWACVEDARQALEGKVTYETWQEGLLNIFQAVLQNKPFILNVYHCVSRERIEEYHVIGILWGTPKPVSPTNAGASFEAGKLALQKAVNSLGAGTDLPFVGLPDLILRQGGKTHGDLLLPIPHGAVHPALPGGGVEGADARGLMDGSNVPGFYTAACHNGDSTGG